MANLSSSSPAAILFDLDNTLCTFVDAKISACNAVINEVGAGSGDDLLRYFLRPVRNFEDTGHIADYLTDIGVYTPEIGMKTENLFKKVKLDSLRLYPGVIRVLTLLRAKNIPLAVVTDAHSHNARERMEHLGIVSYFTSLITPDISGKRKPDHAPFLMAMNALQTCPADTWIVGDSLTREMVPGNELGLTTVYARYGDWIMPDIPDLKPDYTLDQFEDLCCIPGIKKIL
jgi:putative hydrolase of the HAD superfamily